ncbi:hypothetical protein [uncultured Ferrovibrio sp.]|jgi:hypothetical protein|uniref:hypothetical protein n=1 Tax=uncultured Ferrovibrio sp. TaxID=1576913 RepID=UPI00261C5923|nr:hypothetical protein [uncultured Ferrovibrio sp.]
MQSLDKTAVQPQSDAELADKAADQLRMARSFAEAIHLNRKLFEDPEEFDAWRAMTADLYYMLLHVCTARLTLELGYESTPQDLMRYLDGIEGGRLVNRFVSPDAPDDLRAAPAISKAVVTGTLLRQIKSTTETLTRHADLQVADEASVLQLNVQSLALLFADLGASLLIAAGMGDKLGMPRGPNT